MRCIRLILISIVSFLGTACDNNVIDNTVDFEFETIDKEANRIDLIVSIHYRLKNRLEKELRKEYGIQYPDSLLLPLVSANAKNILTNYSAGEIYNYKRNEIEQKLAELTRIQFANHDLELTNFVVRSVGLSDTLIRKLLNEHIERTSGEGETNIK